VGLVVLACDLLQVASQLRRKQRYGVLKGGARTRTWMFPAMGELDLVEANDLRELSFDLRRIDEEAGQFVLRHSGEPCRREEPGKSMGQGAAPVRIIHC
jgi:hypothetical protein